MKIVVTGSLGHVSKPLTQQLIKGGHSVTVISSKADRQAVIEALGAKAAIGTMEDVDFLTSVFTGADAVYCMLASGNNIFSDPSRGVADVMVMANKIANNYVQAIQQSGVTRIVYLSTVGAHTDKGNGLLAMHNHAEHILAQLPADVSVSFMRPVGFYDNLFNFISGIKARGVIAANYGGEDVANLVSPIDIAAAIVEELTSSIVAKKARYVASDVLTCNEVATVLGDTIGLPELKWIVISDEQQLNGLKAFGMNASFAESFVEMNAFIHSGKVYEDYNRNKPTLGKVKIKEFAKEFAVAYHQQ